jgi:hypothetical protein
MSNRYLTLTLTFKVSKHFYQIYSYYYSNLLLFQTEYGVAATQKLVRSRGGKWAFEVNTPFRKVKVDAGATKGKNDLETNLEFAWDADNDKNAKVRVA